jgi:hypothetical protein
MVGSLSRREHAIADKAPARVLTDDSEHLADLVGSHGARVSLSFFFSSNVGRLLHSQVQSTAQDRGRHLQSH